MLLEFKWEIRSPFLVAQWYWDFYEFHEESGFIIFYSIELCMPLELSTHVRTLSRCGGHLRLSLASPQRIQTSLYLVQWKTSRHSSHCREIWPSFDSGHLIIHSNWGSKHRIHLTYLLLREGYSWCACGKLAYLFNRILGIHSLLETIWRPWCFPRVPVLKLVFL